MTQFEVSAQKSHSSDSTNFLSVDYFDISGTHTQPTSDQSIQRFNLRFDLEIEEVERNGRTTDKALKNHLELSHNTPVVRLGGSLTTENLLELL